MLMYKHVNICELVLKGSGTEAFEHHIAFRKIQYSSAADLHLKITLIHLMLGIGACSFTV